MTYSMRKLTDAEKEKFLKNNWWGILCFAGEEPYAIPVAYQYKMDTILLGFQAMGRKMGYINKSRNVCLTVCRPSSLASDPKQAYPYTTVIIEGTLEEITDRSKYGLPPLPEGVMVKLYTIKQKRVGTQKLEVK